MPIVSIVVPTFRRYELLLEALESVRGQTFQDFLCVVVDDHSGDGGKTKRTVESVGDPRFLCHSLPTKHGPAGARNAAMPFCTGPYVSFLDSDDLMLPRKLESQIDLLENDPELAMAYSDEHVLLNSGAMRERVHWSKIGHDLPSGYIAREFFQDSFVGTMTVTVRKSVFESMDGFDTNMTWNEDDDLWFRIMMKHRVVACDYVAGIRRLHDGNMSRNRCMMLHHQFACISKYITHYPDFIIENREIVKRRIWQLLKQYLRDRLIQAKLPRSSLLKTAGTIYRQISKLRT